MASTPPTLSDLLAQVSTLLGKRNSSQIEFANWLAGSATGGPNGDGLFPLTDSTGFVRMAPSPAKQMAGAPAGGGSLTQAGVAALAAAAQGDVDATVQVLGTATAGGPPERISPFMFTSRRTVDLPAVTAALADDYLQIHRNDGSDYRLKMSALTQLTTGKINVKEPPYNCKGDYREVRDGVVVQYANTIKSASNPWVPSDVGKLLFIGNKSNFRATMPRIITGFVSAGQINFGPAVSGGTSGASYGDSNLVVAWATDDTAGMQAALLAAAPPAGLPNVFGGVVEMPPGFYLTDNLYLPAKTAIFGYGPRQSVIVRKPSTSANPTLSNKNPSDDFPVLINMGIYGLKSLAGTAQRGYYYGATAGFGTYYYTDPYPHWHGIHIWETSGDAFVQAGQGNGILTDINIAGPGGCGFYSTAFDMDIANLYVIAAANAAVWMDYGASGNNINNGKFSYSAGNGYAQTPHGYDVGALVYIGDQASNNKLNNCRAQESFLSGYVIGGLHNSLTACAVEDVGNVAYTPAVQPANKPRAGVQIMPGATDCYVDVLMSYAIPYGHAVNRATHALFVSNPGTGSMGNDVPTYNTGKIRTLASMRSSASYANGVTATDGRAIPPTTGAYAPGLVGTDDPNGISPLNDDFKVNTVQIA